MKFNPTPLAVAALLCIVVCGSACAQDAYLGVGVPGLVHLGYAAPVGANWGLRGEVSGGLNRTVNGNRNGVDMTGTVKYSTLGAFADYFPFEGRFRLVAGVGFNDTKVTLKATGTNSTTINGKPVNMTGEYYNVAITYPSATPSLGIGFGHQNSTEKGLGFFTDVGAMLGKFSFSSSTSLVGKQNITQADVDAQSAKVRDDVAKVTVLPSISLGAVYRF